MSSSLLLFFVRCLHVTPRCNLWGNIAVAGAACKNARLPLALASALEGPVILEHFERAAETRVQKKEMKSHRIEYLKL